MKWSRSVFFFFPKTEPGAMKSFFLSMLKQKKKPTKMLLIYMYANGEVFVVHCNLPKLQSWINNEEWLELLGYKKKKEKKKGSVSGDVVSKFLARKINCFAGVMCHFYGF